MTPDRDDVRDRTTDGADGALHTGATPSPHGASDVTAMATWVRNLDRGQIIEMDVRGVHSERELEDRLLRLVAIRQPAELRVALEADRWDVEPDLAQVRAAVEGFGGELTISLTLPPEPAGP